MSAHTPGPWAYEEYGDTGDCTVGTAVDINGRPLQGRLRSGEGKDVEAVAFEVKGAHNAALIAAAPDLLDALRWYAGDGSTYDGIDIGQRAREVIAQLKVRS